MIYNNANQGLDYVVRLSPRAEPAHILPFVRLWAGSAQYDLRTQQLFQPLIRINMLTLRYNGQNVSF